MASFSKFLHAPTRMIWIDTLEQYFLTFEKLDSSGDGVLERHELVNMIGRMTADGGPQATRCRCPSCAPWSETLVDVGEDKDLQRVEHDFTHARAYLTKNSDDKHGTTIGGTGIESVAANWAEFDILFDRIAGARPFT